MVTVNLEQRARELLAAEYERDGRPSDADFMRVGLPVCDADIRALRAIVAALRQQPAPVVDDGNGVRACPVLIAARAHDVGTTGVLRGNADLVPAEHTHT